MPCFVLLQLNVLPERLLAELAFLAFLQFVVVEVTVKRVFVLAQNAADSALHFLFVVGDHVRFKLQDSLAANIADFWLTIVLVHSLDVQFEIVVAFQKLLADWALEAADLFDNFLLLVPMLVHVEPLSGDAGP